MRAAEREMSGDLTENGILYPPEALPDVRTAGLVTQLLDLGFAAEVPGGSVLLPWECLHDVLDDGDLAAASLLPIPVVDDEVVPSLTSVGGVPSDDSYRVSIRAWLRREGGVFTESLNLLGPVCDRSPIGPFTLGRHAYRTVRAVIALNRRGPSERNERDNRLAFVDVRDNAERAGAPMDRMMRTTIIVRPRMLALELERQHVGDQIAVTVAPTFDGAPPGWLRAFDRSRTRVRECYSVPSADGEDVQIVLDDAVQEVLREVRRLPGRRVAGPRARRLLQNPVAFFGEAARAALDIESLERSLSALREDTWSFRIHVERADSGRVDHVDVLLEPLGERIEAASEIRRITSPDGLAAFTRRLEEAVAHGHSAVAWADRDVELGDAAGRIQALRGIVGAWQSGEAIALAEAWGAASGADESAGQQGGAGGNAFVISADFVLDLSRYHERVESIGIETPFGIATVPLSDKGAWAPEEAELALLLRLGDTASNDPSAVSLTRRDLSAFIRDVRAAEREGRGSVALPHGEAIATGEARAIIDALPSALREDDAGAAMEPDGRTNSRAARVGLLIKSNVDDEDYAAVREKRLAPPPGAAALLPTCLAPGVALKAHQREGLAALQHLYAESPDSCSGVLLADDMGLGKTLQILALVARAREDDPDLAPALVVAPVTLLENWAGEIERFFAPGALPYVTLYGTGLRTHRATHAEIDAQLLESGMTRFLRPGWHEGAALVLTTYETLRDYEFSFADIRWSIVACDEAQKIKNPNALVSRAVKKLKARFRIAATGTPVENNLTDLWSIFDFMQPGLLEPLNRFNRIYRRPIEARTDEQKQSIEALRALIRPQIIRRTKQQVARDLPSKVYDEPAKFLVMSGFQKDLYAAALDAREIAAALAGTGTALLNLLAVLRRICTDPRTGEELDGSYPPLSDYRSRAPKMDWLVGALEDVRTRGEKALIFVDRKDVQRLVQHYISEWFGFAPEIINGETPTAGGGDSRQRRVDRFQARSGFGVLILSPVAAGVGLNIQEANHVIHYMRHWNPAKEDQATDRAYRIGQERDVRVYTPIVCGDGWESFDQRLDQLLERKRGIADDILNGAEPVTEGDFRDLLEVAP